MTGGVRVPPPTSLSVVPTRPAGLQTNPDQFASWKVAHGLQTIPEELGNQVWVAYSVHTNRWKLAHMGDLPPE